jgi:hypothetical protein
MCVIYYDVDLCSPCYEKRMAQNQSAVSDHWERYCGPKHEYIKGPIEGWKGIKAGMLRLGDEILDFKHWLADVERK